MIMHACNSSLSSQNGNDFFLDMLTLGLNEKFRKTEAISFLNVEKRIPCNRLTICAWEQNSGIRLPPDLKEFYASTDGFTVTWKYQNFDKENVIKGRSLTVCGEIKICPLTNLRKLNNVNHRKFSDRNMHYCTPHEKISKALSKALRAEKQNDLLAIYMLSHHHNVGTVCLIYQIDKKQNAAVEAKLGSPSSIWLLDAADCWHFLAENFSAYFRMMLVHLGLEHWQLKFTSSGLTPSSQRAIGVAVSHLLYENCREKSSDSIVCAIPRNVINASVFKIGFSSSKPSKSSVGKTIHNRK